MRARDLLWLLAGCALPAAPAEVTDSVYTEELTAVTAVSACPWHEPVCPANLVVKPMETRGYSVLMPLDDGIAEETLTASAAVEAVSIEEVVPVTVPVTGITPKGVSIYLLPYSMTYNDPDWGRYWANVGTLCGAMASALLVMECLPEDATSWNRKEIQDVPPFTRWYRNIFVNNPELDHDDWVFNYLLHPYAGAVYFMAARSVGFNFWRSFLTSAVISTVVWEFGIEAFVERPSYQDIVITPVVGSIIGELFYKLKRDIVANDYRLWGSPVWGNIVAFLIDPVNGLLDLFRGSRTHGYTLDRESAHKIPPLTSQLLPTMVHGTPGFTLSITF